MEETNFKLTGNKIKLATRPKENQGRASSRCALLGRDISRPVSAVPILNFNFVNEFDFPRSTRRPLSADLQVLHLKDSTRRSIMSTNTKFGTLYADGMTSLESSDVSELENAILPSSKLLHNLLSEPLYSWRNGVRCKPSNRNKIFMKQLQQLTNNDSNETQSVGSDTSSNENEVIKHKAVPKIIELKPDKETEEIVDEREKLTNMMTLVPGLKTKPPLPKKPDLSHLNPPKGSSKMGPVVNQTNFEAITLKTLNPDLLPPKCIFQASIEPNLDSIREVTQVPAEEEVESAQNNPSTSTLDSNVDPIELKFQNWFREEEKANEDIIESELNTDLSLHNLKLQHQKVDSSLSQENTKGSAKENPEAPTSNRRLPGKETVTTKLQPNTPKSVNFSNFDLKELKADYEKYKKSKTTKNFIKQNIKLASAKTPKQLVNAEEDKTKHKFVPTQMKTYADNIEDNKTHDVESWMSSFQEIRASKPATYLDCLNKIDELQESCKDICMDDIPERDKDETTTNRSDSTTYDDIISILQVLEEEDKKSQTKIESIKEMVSELSTTERESSTKNAIHSEVSSSNESSNESEDICQYHNSAKLQEKHKEKGRDAKNFINDCNLMEKEAPSRQSLNTSTNLNNIFSYLDEVDRNCAKSIASAKDRISSTAQVLDVNIKLDTIPKLEELLAHTNVELSHHVIDLSLRLKEKSSSIILLQKELSGLREQITKITKDMNEIVRQKLKTQKEDYENIVKRHQKFIDQLISDKKTLNQQCEGLLHEIKVLEDRYNSNMKAAEHKHKVELQKVKEMHVAGEKIRRERWIDTKTQKIKEMTVKGLEPELDKMAARHQLELTDLRSLHKREIEELELRAARKMQQQCEMLREQLIMEREKALAQEREALKQRYEQMVESEEQNYQEQRRKLLAEHAKRISECEERETAAQLEKERVTRQIQCEFEDKLQSAIRRHNSEINLLKETTELEMEAFRNNYKKQMAIQLTEKEAQIRERSRRERDKEIEAVIERLEAESSECKRQIEQSTENRLKRLREKYEKEIKDLEISEKEAASKYSETKAKLLEAENSIICLRATAKQLEIQLEETKQLSWKLSSERNQMKEIVRAEMKNEVQVLEKEVESLRNDKEKEMQQVYARVKLAVARKEETILELTRDHAALQEKCAYLENMLEQQRREYLIK